MSEGQTMMLSGLALDAVLEPLTRLVTAVQSAPLSQEQLWVRWGKPETRSFQRMRDELGLKPFTGRGESAMYRMAAVLRAEEMGETRNGGAA